MKGVLIFLIIFITLATIIGIIVWYRRNSQIIHTGESVLGMLNIFGKK